MPFANYKKPEKGCAQEGGGVESQNRKGGKTRKKSHEQEQKNWSRDDRTEGLRGGKTQTKRTGKKQNPNWKAQTKSFLSKHDLKKRKTTGGRNSDRNQREQGPRTGDKNGEAGNETGRTNRGKRTGLGNPGDTKKKNTGRGKSPRPLLLPSAFPEPGEKSKGRQKEGTRRCLTSALITSSFVFVVKHSRPGQFLLSNSTI